MSAPACALGLATTRQARPFQCSTSGVTGFVASEKPTAQTSDAETADTADSWVRSPPPSGAETTFHVAPFQCSINGCDFGPTGSLQNPTAQASDGSIAVTPCRKFCRVLPFGVETFVHAEPSQCSARVSVVPSVWSIDPTAHASVADVAETESNDEPNALPKPGLGTMCQEHPRDPACAGAPRTARGDSAMMIVTIRRPMCRLLLIRSGWRDRTAAEPSLGCSSPECSRAPELRLRKAKPKDSSPGSAPSAQATWAQTTVR